MRHPHLREEKKLWNEGYHVAGVDEAGRGPLAGPVVAAAVVITPYTSLLLHLRDSKTLSEKQREELYAKLTDHPRIQWGVGVVSEKVIDKINIFEATKLAMRRAIKNLPVVPNALLLDGNFTIDATVLQKPIIGADATVFSCTAAGIIAKVTRDRLMEKIHECYPQYGFDRHKGYGTKLHLKNLEIFGPCKIHRKTFQPVKVLL